MFLEKTMKRNRALIEAAFDYHKSGRILPDSFIVDVDSFLANAKKILEMAQKHNFRMYFMLKQVGRNPYLAKELVKLGYCGAVVVDFKEAQLMMEHQIPIGNVGHLVQIPDKLVQQIVAYEPEVITVYSLEKVKTINCAAAALGKTQGIMLRVYDSRDLIYSGQSAGIHIDLVARMAGKIAAECHHVKIMGVTSFPCFLYDESRQDIVPQKNLETVLAAQRVLEQLGHGDLIVNTPSTTCVRTIEKMAEHGGNCGEPGHGLSGTTPIHGYQDMEELPAVVYVSEISHNFINRAYCYGGGHYRRSHVELALTGGTFAQARVMAVTPPADESIDYHFALSEQCPVGDTVIMAFRFQMFVTRSDVVLVQGIHKGKPEIQGIYDSLGRKKEIK